MGTWFDDAVRGLRRRLSGSPVAVRIREFAFNQARHSPFGIFVRAGVLVIAVRQAFAQKGVATLKGDWTRRDGVIAKILESHGRAGVPLYLYYAAANAKGAPVILPQILTAETVLHEVQGG